MKLVCLQLGLIVSVQVLITPVADVAEPAVTTTAAAAAAAAAVIRC
jgi:hypothetical protein